MQYLYGDAWDTYPVQPGDCWEIPGAIGAKFLCGDITDAVTREWIAERVFEKTRDIVYVEQQPKIIRLQQCIVYVDAPWTPANETAFRHKAGLAKGNFQQFVQCFWQVLLDADVDEIFLEHTGSIPIAENPYFTECPKAYQRVKTWAILYKGKRPCGLTLFTRRGFPANSRVFDLDDEITGKDDVHTPGILLKVYPKSSVVLDLCFGMGLTARAAHEAGHHFIGVELHPRRMAVALKHQALEDGLPPRRNACLSVKCPMPTENGFYCMPERRVTEDGSP